MDNPKHIRRHILVGGQVQGVGFRPFVYGLAMQYGLTGKVGNTSAGVVIEIQGLEQDIICFIDDLQNKLPPLAKINSCKISHMQNQDEATFCIIASEGAGGHSVLISADTALCGDCEQDMQDSTNRRHAYAFTNCTNCGPRYTITHSIPYDRISTSMACFPLCTQCRNEYEDPLNRRFHAQPNACPLCGPRLWCVVQGAELHKGNFEHAQFKNNAAIEVIAKQLKAGKLVAIKGLGGFHLSCDANNAASIESMRKYKNRPHKPLAVMVPNLAMARRIAHISEQEEALLMSAEKPIVLCKKREHSLPDSLAPDADSIGLVLPYTPLHVVLFKYYVQLHDASDLQALVMTSGNAGGEPICLGNREALKRLKHIAQFYLLHDRDILVRNDDSVCRIMTDIKGAKGEISFLRRARGYVPRPVKLIKNTPSILGMGAELKSTLCLTRENMAFMSQHIGDLQNVETLSFYNEIIEHLQMLLQIKPKAIVHDLHPNFLSTQAGIELAKELNIPCHALQHHFAHAWSVLAEHNFAGKVLALTLDGTGLGLDGTIWGGELLFVDTKELTHKRLGRISPFALAGGDAATKEPWRIALALAQGTEFEQKIIGTQEKTAPMILEMLKRNINSPLTSSVGRLFDAISAGLGLCTHTSYEGQAAIRLENDQGHMPWHNVDQYIQGKLQGKLKVKLEKNDALWELCSKSLFINAVNEKDINIAARRFHLELAHGFAEMAVKAAVEENVQVIALSGGAMQNATLHKLLVYFLKNKGLQVIMHRDVPCGDGGIALGQVAWGQANIQFLC